jgi:hypothetical protein
MNKPLTLGLVAALLMAGGQQVTASICPFPETIAAIEATPGFSCTITSPFGTATISNVSFSPLFTDAEKDTVDADFLGASIGTVYAGFGASLAPVYGVRLPAGDVPDIFNYQISISSISDSVQPPGLVIAYFGASATALAAPATGAVTGTANWVGNVVGSQNLVETVLAPGTRFGNTVATLNGDTTITVSNSLFTAPGSTILGDGIGETFAGKLIPVGTPEPTGLSLFGVGLAALALARRWRAA